MSRNLHASYTQKGGTEGEQQGKREKGRGMEGQVEEGKRWRMSRKKNMLGLVEHGFDPNTKITVYSLSK